jgi:predicted MFS family arabinose efflux permease
MDRTVPEKMLSGCRRHRCLVASSPHPLHGRQRLKGGFYKLALMNRNLILLALCQGLFLTNNVVFIAINGLVGLSLAPLGWMATLPVMGYVVGGAISTSLVAKTQSRYGRRISFQLGLLVALLSALLCAYAAWSRNYWLLCTATVVAGYYSANGQLYRFAAAELSVPAFREKAVSLVMAGGLIGAVIGPNLAARTRGLTEAPFAGAYLSLAVVALLAMALMAFVQFPPVPPRAAGAPAGRPLSQIMRQPVFVVAAVSAALSYGVMNLLMAATPLAMQVCGFPFADAALVLEWHVIGMFAPGFFTGHLIRRFGTLPVMGVGVALNLACIVVALSGRGPAPIHHCAVSAGRGLELPVHRQHHAVAARLQT